MEKSIHDLSEEEIGNLSKEIKELLKEIEDDKGKTKAEKDKNREENEFLNWDNFELSSWLTSTDESKDAHENEKTMPKKKSKKSKKVKNPKGRINSMINESEYSESYKIEDLIKNDETLKELQNLTALIDEDKYESVSKEYISAGSSASKKTSTHNKKNETSESCRADSIREASPSASSATETIQANLKLKRLKEQTKFDKAVAPKPQAENTDLKVKKTSSTSLRTKKRISHKDSNKHINEPAKKPYLEGSPEYIKRHYVPIITKQEARSSNLVGRKSANDSVFTRVSFKTKKPEESDIGSRKREQQLSPSMSEEAVPLFPLKIDCISMFSEDDGEVEGEVDDEGLEEEWSLESDLDSVDPDAIHKQLWNDLLLPTDESDLDLEEFYKQFPKLRKKNSRLETFTENTESILS